MKIATNIHYVTINLLFIIITIIFNYYIGVLSYLVSDIALIWHRLKSS